jgi:hypothetical protein
VGGNRQVPAPNSSGAIMWEPVIIPFIVHDVNDTISLELDDTWFIEFLKAFVPIMNNFVGNGMSIVDIQLNPADSSLYVLLDYLSVNKPEVTNGASLSVVHILPDGSLDTAFAWDAIPLHYGKNSVTGDLMVYSAKKSLLFVIVHEAKTGASILSINSKTGKLLGKYQTNGATYFKSAVLNADETKLYVCGYEMLSKSLKTSRGLVTALLTSSTVLTEDNLFGINGNITLQVEDKYLNEYQSTRLSKLLWLNVSDPDPSLVVVGDAIAPGFWDNKAVQIWMIDTKGTVDVQTLWTDNRFPNSSTVVDQVIVDPQTEDLYLIGGIRFAPFQSNSQEIWIGKFHREDSSMESYHMPCTPDLYASSRGGTIVNNRIVFIANMQVSRLSWGRQSMIGSFPMSIQNDNA